MKWLALFNFFQKKKKKKREKSVSIVCITYLWNVTERGFVVRQSGVENLTEEGAGTAGLLLNRVVALDPHGVEAFV